MNDARIGASLRALRVRRGWRQIDLAARTGLSRDTIGQIERGRIASVRVETLRVLASGLGGRIDLAVRSDGTELDRLFGGRHSAMHESLARMVRQIGGWELAPEVSFSIFGERGVIDALLWHERSASLVIVELKTELVDVNELLSSMDRRERLARRIASARSWHPRTVSVWLLLADGRTNRRRLAAHRVVLRTRFPSDGRTVAGWLRLPVGRLAALSFLPDADAGRHTARFRPTRRVRARAASR